MDKAIEKLRWSVNKAYNHKYKIILTIGTIYVVKKCYNLYVYIKPFWHMRHLLTGNSNG